MKYDQDPNFAGAFPGLGTINAGALRTLRAPMARTPDRGCTQAMARCWRAACRSRNCGFERGRRPAGDRPRG